MNPSAKPAKASRSLSFLVEEGELRAAYERVVELWRRKPHASLAALLAELRAHAGPEKSPLDSVIVDGNSVSSRERLVEVLATLKPDPYVFDWMVQELGHPRFDLVSGNPRQLYALIVEEMTKLQDERVAPWVAELPAFLQAHKGRRHGQLSPDEIAALTEMFAGHELRPPVLEALTEDEAAELAALRAPLDALAQRAGNRAEKRASLFAHVCADFDDDVAKEVFADFLLEEGDPLGEFIVLSLKLAREGSLDATLERRHHGLLEHARRFQPMGDRFERGFAVEVRLADGAGIRRGHYGPEPGWGTIAVCDVPPSSDECHTESLRELDLGSTFIADLAKLKKPLGVTKLRWRAPSQNGRAKWKKISVLPKLTHLVLFAPSEGSFAWVLEGAGKNLRELSVDLRWHIGRHVPWICEVLGKLERVRLGAHLVFTRAEGKTQLTIDVPDARVLAELEQELEPAPRPLVDEVAVEGPGDEKTYAKLLTLGRARRAKLAPSPAALAATVTSEGDASTIEPARAHPVFDVPALRSLLADTKAPRRIAITSSVLMSEAAEYFRVAVAAGARELSLATTTRGRFVLTIREGALDAEVGRDDHAPELRSAIASFGGRIEKVIIRHTPSLKGVDALRDVAPEVELVPDERVLAAMFRYGHQKGRSFIDPNGTAALLMPSTADLVLQGKPTPKELRVGQPRFALGPWMEWVARTKIPVTFARDWKVTARSRLSWEDGIVARLWVDGNWPAFVTLVADVPDQAIKELDLRSSVAPSAAAKPAIARVARAHTIVS